MMTITLLIWFSFSDKIRKLQIGYSEKLENSLKQVKFVASQTRENFLKIAKQAQFFSGSFLAQTFKLSFIINFSEGSIKSGGR